MHACVCVSCIYVPEAETEVISSIRLPLLTLMLCLSARTILCYFIHDRNLMKK